MHCFIQHRRQGRADITPLRSLSPGHQGLNHQYWLPGRLFFQQRDKRLLPGASMGDPDMPQGWLQPPNTSFDVHQAYHMDESSRTTPGQIRAYSQVTPASRGSLQEQDPSEQPSYPAASHGDTYAEDDDYYGVESDDEPEAQVVTQNFNQLSLIMASANRDDGPPRSFTTYLNEPNVLASYQPTPGSSLNNPKTARIFLHFIHSTGPSISIFERHPIDPSTMFGAPVPTAQQGLWTYTLPFKALEHQALLQAILALSSLHIAYLQEAPPTVSLKHYHYALRRVGVAVGLPMRRKQVGTLAAALLLAYYEVMSADHTKWNSHVAGAVQLLREIDFAAITRDLRQHRRRTWAKATSKDFLFGNALLEDDPFSEQESSIDENLIGSILGHAVNYDEFGRVDEGYSRPFNPELTRKDIESFRIQCDLYWWCCKQDIIQSIIGGNPLFFSMAFSSFGQCPPRAAVGRLDAIYGSADHLWLLLGRLTDFGCRDRRRKLKTFKAAGAEWRPGPELSKFMARFAPRSPSSSSPPPKPPFPSNPSQKTTTGTGNYGPKSTSPSSQSPPMYGMVPSTGPRSLPPAFAEAQSRRDSPKENEEEEHMTYEHAEQEWESILSTFEMFARALGPHFLPLPADSAPPIATPFGPALQYRTQTIAVIWGFYYLGRILLHRLHPCMPPAMMVAAGVAAPTTGEFTQLVGKIAAGIYYPQSFNIETGNLSPTLGSCLIEITVPIFFAAIQYTDRAQRYWIATRLRPGGLQQTKDEVPCMSRPATGRTSDPLRRQEPRAERQMQSLKGDL
ncbi:C6 finger domain protein [Aspergillus terreus]|uniref:C6 finger domain protein n=1 Tax=Aspergillus terreus TaxID=33178 RepID=A0A5M3YN23_ASPTE|nr:hypothetical protein ATETN484_0001055700 [Aspergillus terreus]GFF12413.1 C6 finger domain protein [Aspergillus terreus]